MQIDELLKKSNQIPAIEKGVVNSFAHLPLKDASTFSEILADFEITHDMLCTKKMLELAYFAITLKDDPESTISDLASVICERGDELLTSKEPSPESLASLSFLRQRFSPFAQMAPVK